MSDPAPLKCWLQASRWRDADAEIERLRAREAELVAALVRVNECWGSRPGTVLDAVQAALAKVEENGK